VDDSSTKTRRTIQNDGVYDMKRWVGKALTLAGTRAKALLKNLEQLSHTLEALAVEMVLAKKGASTEIKNEDKLLKNAFLLYKAELWVEEFRKAYYFDAEQMSNLQLSLGLAKENMREAINELDVFQSKFASLGRALQGLNPGQTLVWNGTDIWLSGFDGIVSRLKAEIIELEAWTKQQENRGMYDTLDRMDRFEERFAASWEYLKQTV
jgi:hypothetical protein